MTPVMLHDDGSECHHEGAPQRPATDDLTPLCPAGLAVPHVRIGDKVVPMGDALSAFRSMAEAITRSLTPMIPHLRVLAAAAEAIREEREAEEGRRHATP